jgi:putative FmdB family regulatory protein
MIYEFICHECEFAFEKEYPMAKAPDRSKCPECSKLCNRHYGSVGVHFKGDDWHTNKSRKSRDRNKKTEGKMAEALVDWTKKSLDSAKGSDFYKPMTPDWKKMEKEGKARRLTEAEHKDRANLAEQAATDAYNGNNRILQPKKSKPRKK